MPIGGGPAALNRTRQRTGNDFMDYPDTAGPFQTSRHSVLYSDPLPWPVRDPLSFPQRANI
jgi:hypothetical protein